MDHADTDNTAEGTPQAYMEASRKARDAGDLQRAFEIAEAGVQHHPEHAGIRGMAAQVLRALGRPDAALTLLAAATASDGADPGLLADQALLLREAGRLDQAETVLDRLERRDPTSPRLAMERSRLARVRGDIDAALEVTLAGIAARPRNVNLRLHAAQLLRGLGRREEALAMLATATDRDDAGSALLLEHAAVAREAGRLDVAKHLLQRLEQADPNTAKLIAERCRLLRAAGDLDGALNVAETGMRDRPHHTELRILAVQILRLLGRHQAALDLLTPAVADPDAATALLIEHAATLRDVGSLAAAAMSLDRVEDRTRHAPSTSLQAQLYVERSRLTRAGGDLAAALEIALAGVARYPQAVALRRQVISLARDTGDLATAIAQVRVLAEMRETSPDMLATLAALLAAAQRPQEALALYKLNHAKNGTRLEPLIALARMHLQLGELEEAELLLNRHAGHWHGHPDFDIVLADLRWAAGELDEGLAILTEAHTARPSHAELRHRLANRLIDLGGTSDAMALIADWEPQSTLHRKWKAEVKIKANLECGDLAAALEQRHAIEALPTPGDSDSSRIGTLYMLTGDLAAAKNAFLDHLKATSFEQTAAGRSQKLSRSFFGAFLNELSLDADLTKQAMRAGNGASPDDVAELSSLVEREPGAFGPALALCLAMRKQGHVLQSAPPAATVPGLGPIPRIIYTFWDSVEPPEDVAGLLARWAALNPAFEYRPFDDGAARDFLEANRLDDVSRAYWLSVHPAQRADLFRLACLWCTGGVYVDADDYCRRSLDDLIFPDASLIVAQEPFFSIGNNFLAAAPRHPTIGLALKTATEEVLAGTAAHIWLATGPGLLTRAFAASAVKPGTAAPRPGYYVLSRTMLLRFIAMHRPARYKKTEKAWQIALQGEQSAAAVDPFGSLLATLGLTGQAQ